jgi:nicotinamide-nucleotide amidase
VVSKSITEAHKLAAILRSKSKKIVFAESCTGGMVSALLAQIPGVSEVFCGSFVTYRQGSKQAWLGISKKSLRGDGAVSLKVTKQMALAALRRTPEADLSAAVTGHFGPGAPRGKDGRVYLAVASRAGKPVVIVVEIVLPKASNRVQRQRKASLLLFALVRSLLNEIPAHTK